MILATYESADLALWDVPRSCMVANLHEFHNGQPLRTATGIQWPPTGLQPIIAMASNQMAKPPRNCIRLGGHVNAVSHVAFDVVVGVCVCVNPCFKGF